MLYLPNSAHTWKSAVNITQLPNETRGVRLDEAGLHTITVAIKDAAGRLLGSAIPKVSIVKDGSYFDEEEAAIEDHVDILALTERMLRQSNLGGFAVEGFSPYGKPASPFRRKALARAIFSGLPVVCCGRGNTEGFAVPQSPFISGSNLVVTKARLLMMACLLKFGALPPAKDPTNPTDSEITATKAKVADYQAIFDTH
jgi:hypothetical protein